MKNSKRREEHKQSEQTSFTISKIRKDISGNNTTHRTYYSIITKVQEPDIKKDNQQQVISKNVSSSSKDLPASRTQLKQKTERLEQKYVQVPLFTDGNQE